MTHHRFKVYDAQLHEVVDGDTVRLLIDQGLGSWRVEDIRLRGIDTPELFTGADRVAGTAARDFTRYWFDKAILASPNDPWPFEVTTFKNRNDRERRTFVRYEGAIIRHDTNESLVDAIITELRTLGVLYRAFVLAFHRAGFATSIIRTEDQATPKQVLKEQRKAGL